MKAKIEIRENISVMKMRERGMKGRNEETERNRGIMHEKIENENKLTCRREERKERMKEAKRMEK